MIKMHGASLSILGLVLSCLVLFMRAKLSSTGWPQAIEQRMSGPEASLGKMADLV